MYGSRRNRRDRDAVVKTYKSWYNHQMIIRSEQDMINFGKHLAEGLVPPVAIELIGDIGTGKTTLTKGIAKALGITDEVTSPSFTISKIYRSQTRPLTLAHFDFYRLTDPGIMRSELSETLTDPETITVIEWAASVKNTLPKNTRQISISYNDNGTRTIKVKP